MAIQTGAPLIKILDTKRANPETAESIINNYLGELQERYAKVEIVNVFTNGGTIAAAFVVYAKATNDT